MVKTEVRKLFLASTLFFISFPSQAIGLKRIEDNSFLIEEAYTQAEGIQQLIQRLRWNHDTQSYQYSLTHEMPIDGEHHQFSYIVPYFYDEDFGGVGDIDLEHKVLWFKRPEHLLFASKFSLLFPTGKEERGLGAGSMGEQLHLTGTFIFSEHFIAHANLGTTHYSKRENTQGYKHSSWNWDWGGSLVYLYSQRLNFLLEIYAEDNELINREGHTYRVRNYTFNPGMRGKYKLTSGGEWIPGLSFPLVRDTHFKKSDHSVLLYLSFEG